MSSSDPIALAQEAGQQVRDPATGRSLADLDRLVMPELDGETLKVGIKIPRAYNAPLRERMHRSFVEKLRGLGFEGEIKVGFIEIGPPPKDPVRGMSGPGVQAHGGPMVKQPVPGVKHIVAISSGKGGVGKSTVACRVATALAMKGFSVGLVDADIYGPSLPKMMSLTGTPRATGDKRILPLESQGVRCMSIGFLVDENEPIIWRGPMVMGVVRQFLHQVAWGELDYLLVDLPPGTGDAQLTMIQVVDIAGAVIVTTPQDIALLDAVRGVEMFRKLEVPLLGVVENMSWFTLPDGSRVFPFGQGGAAKLAKRFGVDVLAQVPLETPLREAADEGRAMPIPGSIASDALVTVADEIARRLPVDGA
jgi:ATP-binding protein involved in chromosome partitioning